MAIFQVWRNHVKWFSERRKGPTAAMKLGRSRARRSVEDVLAKRWFVSRLELPAELARIYWREVETRRIARNRRHTLRYAF